MERMTDVRAGVRSGVSAPHAPPHAAWPRQAALRRALRSFEEAGVDYCVLSGYERLYSPEDFGARDLDCIVDPRALPARAAGILYRNAGKIGADVIRWEGGPNHYVTLAVRNRGAVPDLTPLDLHPAFECSGRRFFSAADVLRGRRRYEDVWVPAVDVEFACYLIKKSLRGSLQEAQLAHLAELFRRDPDACRARLATFWDANDADLIAEAAGSGRWTRAVAEMPRLRAALKRRHDVRHPVSFLSARLGAYRRRARGVVQCTSGLHVVLLGPDGVGKSTVIDAISEIFTPLFAGGVATDTPQGILRRPQAPTDRPHDKVPWGLFGSLAKSVYWFLYYTPGYYRVVFPALREGRLHLSHRYLVDALVDSKRYRYNGPRWVLSLLWRLAVKPDLIVLLDAPPEVIQARKSEVAPEETARQCQAYRSVVARLPQGRIVDAGQPLAAVVADVRDAVLGHLSKRTARRLKLQPTR